MTDHATRPIIAFDGHCTLCRRLVTRWQHLTGDSYDYHASQDIADDVPYIEASTFQRSVVLIYPDGRYLTGSQAVLTAIADTDLGTWPLWLTQRSDRLANLAEWSYRLVADHRPIFAKLDRWIWGEARPLAQTQVRAWFIRLMGLIYLMAFGSLWVQIHGLIGSGGILPAQEYLQAVDQVYGAMGYWLLPTWGWLGSGDLALHILCALGVIGSFGLMLCRRSGPFALLTWSLYLSLIHLGNVFLSYQWDGLLVEAGFLVVFLAPWRRLRYSPYVSYLLRWLLFRLMFASGVVKVISGDPTWLNLAALQYHFETQPLPTWTAWFAHQLPDGLLTVATGITLGIELICPFLALLPGRLRRLGFYALVGLQLMIMATGNYGFFNLLTIALCLLLMEDRQLPSWLRVKLPRVRPLRPGWGTNLRATFLIILALCSLSVLLTNLGLTRRAWSPPPQFFLVNHYGLFALMTTARPEITIQGSNDGTTWESYRFKYKPGDLDRRPGFVAPHMPRLDWQMWFAALGRIENHPWLARFMAALLQGSPQVLALIEHNPFPDQPPTYLRAVRSSYHFTDRQQRAKQGNWWTSAMPEIYYGPIARQSQKGSEQ